MQMKTKWLNYPLQHVLWVICLFRWKKNSCLKSHTTYMYTVQNSFDYICYAFIFQYIKYAHFTLYTGTRMYKDLKGVNVILALCMTTMVKLTKFCSKWLLGYVRQQQLYSQCKLWSIYQIAIQYSMQCAPSSLQNWC